MSALEALVALAEPPRRPRRGTLTWDQVYERLGTGLPADYVALISCYGAGLLGCREWLGLCDPLDPGRPCGLLACATDAGDAYRFLRDGPASTFAGNGRPANGRPDERLNHMELDGLDGFAMDFPRAVWPEPGGFLCCAASRDGDYIGWLTVGRPDSWPVMVWPQQSDGDTLIDLTLTEVLVGWLKGDLDLPGLPRCDEPHTHDRFSTW